MKLLSRFFLSSLQAFEAAARTGSFARAAQELGLSPSAISHAIRKLEASSHMQLFTRTSREITLTPEGRLLLKQVQRGFEEMSYGFMLASEAKRLKPLRLHSAPSFATQWLGPRLESFRKDYPGIDLRISADTNYASFDRDDYDLDIVYGEPLTTLHESIPLVIEEVTPLCNPNLAASIESPQDLYKQTLIKSEGKSVQWGGWFSANRLRQPSQFGLGFDRSSMAISAAADGLGIVLESTFLAKRELESGKLKAPLLGRSSSIHYVGHHLVYPRRHHTHESFNQFKQWLLATLGK